MCLLPPLDSELLEDRDNLLFPSLCLLWGTELDLEEVTCSHTHVGKTGPGRRVVWSWGTAGCGTPAPTDGSLRWGLLSVFYPFIFLLQERVPINYTSGWTQASPAFFTALSYKNFSKYLA